MPEGVWGAHQVAQQRQQRLQRAQAAALVPGGPGAVQVAVHQEDQARCVIPAQYLHVQWNDHVSVSACTAVRTAIKWAAPSPLTKHDTYLDNMAVCWSASSLSAFCGRALHTILQPCYFKFMAWLKTSLWAIMGLL